MRGPVALAYARFAEPTRAEAHEEYHDAVAPCRDGTAYAIPGEFVIVRGVRPGSDAWAPAVLISARRVRIEEWRSATSVAPAP